MTKVFSVRTALLAAIVLAAAALACSSDDGTEAPAAASDAAATPMAASEAPAEVVDPNARGGATGLGEFEEYLITQTYLALRSELGHSAVDPGLRERPEHRHAAMADVGREALDGP